MVIAVLTGVFFAAMIVSFAWTFHYLRIRSRHTLFIQAQLDFHRKREWLEADFVQQASRQAPNSEQFRWYDCSFEDDVAYVRNRSTGELSALVAMTISEEAIAPPAPRLNDMSNRLQIGTAIFRFDGQHWSSDGRAILNLSPKEAIQYFPTVLEVVQE